MKKTRIKINKINQNYFYEILKKNPKLKSGRKRYSFYYKRVNTNILLSKFYKQYKNFLIKNISIKETKHFFIIK